MTFHPNWEAKIDGNKTDKIMVFPSFMAIEADPGIHEISFEYQVDKRKLPLLFLGILSLIPVSFYFKKTIQD